MTHGFLHLIKTAHSLRQFADNPDPDRLLRGLRTASSGESVMIRAALSLVPASWLPDAAQDVTFRLCDVGSLDARNTRALLEALAVQADHLDALCEVV